MRIAWRSPRLFEEGGLFLVVGARSICLLPAWGR